MDLRKATAWHALALQWLTTRRTGWNPLTMPSGLWNLRLGCIHFDDRVSGRGW